MKDLACSARQELRMLRAGGGAPAGSVLSQAAFLSCARPGWGSYRLWSCLWVSSGFPRGRARCVPHPSGSPRARRSLGEPSPAVTPPPVTLECRPGPARSNGLTSKGVRGLALAPGPARALRSRRWRETWAARKDISCRRPGHWRIGGSLGDLRTGLVRRRLERTGPLVPVLHLPLCAKAEVFLQGWPCFHRRC